MFLYNAEQHVKLDPEQEYLTRAEIYISNAASMTLRKVNKYHWLLDWTQPTAAIQFKKQNELESRLKGLYLETAFSSGSDKPDLSREIQLAQHWWKRSHDVGALAASYLQADEGVWCRSMSS